MSQKERVGNTPHSVMKYEETLRKGAFPKRKIEGEQAEVSDTAAKQARDAQQGTLDDAEKARPQRTGNTPHHKHPEPVYPQRKPVPKQKA